MSNWYKLDIGDALDCVEEMKRIQRSFMAPYLAAPAGSGRALFVQDNKVSGHALMFFTPQASDVALALGALPCVRPDIRDGHIEMLAGDDDLRAHFPGQQPS